ncbi:UDP-N-acetylmuramate dehydrogenase [Hydrogenobacter thermophilus]|uniref:UDP-N-acetylmuramate dehydrogenase n=1 Tax=Hydrogenobacter thermophilus TaxID=940 RepID=UPI0030F5D320
MHIERDVSLAQYTTIKIGGRAGFLCFPNTYSELVLAVKMAQDKGLPIFILGRGSNTIFGNFEGFVISTKNFRDIKIYQEDNKVLVEAGCGLPLSELVKVALDLNLDGIYRLVGFPATVGGAVAMNAGAFGCEVSHYIKSVLVMDWEGRLHKIDIKDVSFSYRSSPFPEMGVVLKVEFEFFKANFDVKAEYNLIKEKRKLTQPINMPTSGSTFKNPPKAYAGELLEKVGMKGYKIGDVAFSQVHANFLVNLGNGKVGDVIKILHEAKRRVYEEFGIELQEEVKVIESCSTHGR